MLDGQTDRWMQAIHYALYLKLLVQVTRKVQFKFGPITARPVVSVASAFAESHRINVLLLHVLAIPCLVINGPSGCTLCCPGPQQRETARW
jgi:hypothetical protein